ncbi:hypothetical protein SPAR27_1600 [Streptococcus pneumoniae SPAR27]|nr:hypothetical protein SPAR27_1600 [Streptococcus pneumoniae SPAR27]
MVLLYQKGGKKSWALKIFEEFTEKLWIFDLELDSTYLV